MNALALCGLTLVLLVAGCSSPAQAPHSTSSGAPTADSPRSATATALGLPDPPAATHQPRFHAVLADINRTAHEPDIVVAPTGSIFVHGRGVVHGTAEPDADASNYVWRSRDNGATFQHVGSAAMERLGPSEGIVAALATGRILVAYSMGTNGSLDTNEYDRTVEIHASDDDGDSWHLLSTVWLPSAHRTWLWPAGGQVVHLGVMAYIEAFHLVSTDAGASWSKVPGRIHDVPTYNGHLVGNAHVLLWPWFTGLIEQMPGEADHSTPWILDAHVSSDGGMTWTPHRITEITGRASVFAGTAADATGALYVAWASWSTTGSAVSYAVSVDDGNTWSIHVVAEGPGLRVMPWIAASASGSVGLAWYQNDGYSGNPLFAKGPWFTQYATVSSASAQPAISIARPLADAILDGPLCIQAFSCGEVVRNGKICFTPMPDPVGDCTDLDHVRNYDDYVGLAYRANGKAVMGFVATQGFGLPTWTRGEPGHIIMVKEN